MQFSPGEQQRDRRQQAAQGQAGEEQAANLVLDILAAKSTTTELLVEVIRAYRCAALPPLPASALEQAPKLLRAIIG